LRREPNQKGVNGKPPGQEDAGADEPSPTSTEEKAASLPTTETIETPEDVVSEAVDEAVSSSEQPASESLVDQVQDLNLNEPPAQETGLLEEYEEEVEEAEEDDGDGEWISSSALHFCSSPP
jgi:RNA-binding protein NOB1